MSWITFSDRVVPVIACFDLSLILLSLLFFARWMIDTECSMWEVVEALRRKGKKHPSERHNLIWRLAMRFKRVHLPETHALCWVLWVQLKIFLPLMIKTKSRMLIFPCLLSTERLSQAALPLKSCHYQWFLWQGDECLRAGDFFCIALQAGVTAAHALASSLNPQISHIMFNTGIGKWIILFCYTSWLYKYSFKMSHPTPPPKKKPPTAM